MASGDTYGKVDSLTGPGEVLIVRSTGEQVVAQAGDLICAGDTVIAGPGSSVIIQTAPAFDSNLGYVLVGGSDAAVFDAALAATTGPQLPGSSQANPVDVGQPSSAAQTGVWNSVFSPSPCFLAGTWIATPQGDVAVETLKPGDLVLTADGRASPVLWLGYQTLQTRAVGAAKQPICIRADALGTGLPYRDLTLTADHGMIVGGYVINASALVNGGTIDWLPLEALKHSFTIYHIETENHEAILANGAPSETFVDATSRSNFDNYQEYLNLYGAERIIPEMPLPRISSARLVPQSIRKVLLSSSFAPQPQKRRA